MFVKDKSPIGYAVEPSVVVVKVGLVVLPVAMGHQAARDQSSYLSFQ